MTQLVRILLAVLFVVAVAVSGPPAHACGCGAMEPQDQRHLGVDSETAAIVFDGRTETIALSLGLTTDSPDVAFLMPIPAKAEFAVTEPDLFDELYDHTRPETRVRYTYDLRFWLAGSAGGDGAPGSGAVVVDRQRIGAYDVVQLSGDTAGVGAWLADNGFQSRPEVLAGLGTYLEQGWWVAAAKLALDAEMTGEALQPLVLSFVTDELVYPMRLSALASSMQQLRFYVFAEHRQDVTLGGRSLDTTFAGRVAAAQLRADGRTVTADLVGERRYFLTRVDDDVDPTDITTDLEFVPSAAGDVDHREINWRTEDRGGLVWLGIVVTVGLLLVVGAFVGWYRHNESVARRRRAMLAPPD